MAHDDTGMKTPKKSVRFIDNQQQTSPASVPREDIEGQQWGVGNVSPTQEAEGEVIVEGDVIRLVIPEIPNTRTGVESIDTQQVDGHPSIDTTDLVIEDQTGENLGENNEEDLQVINSSQSEPVQGSCPSTPRRIQTQFVTSKNYLKDHVPPPRKGFNKQVYFVKSSPEPYLRPESRCTNVTATLTKPVVSPVIENPYARVDSGYSSRYSSGNSLRKQTYDKNKMSYLDRDLYTMQGTSNVYQGGYQGGYQTSGYHKLPGFQTSAGYQTAMSMTRSQEKEELQRINDRFTAYIQKVRHLREQSNHLDSSSFLKSAKILEEEVANLKNLYESELENVRKQLEECMKERNSYQMQCKKYQQATADMESRLMVETEKNRKLIDEMNNTQRRVAQLETELHESKFTPRPPQDDVQHLRRDIDNLTRENETLKRRYEKEQLARQEVEEHAHQLTKKLEFNEQVHQQQMNELRERLENSMATILTLEGRIRDLSKSDTSIPELLKQVREAAEEELQKYQAESEDVYNRNITSLKAQMDNDAKAIERCNTENSQLRGGVVELKGRITSLEGQIQNLQHQKSSADALLQQERAKSAEQIQAMEKKLREVQDLLVVKMREVNTSRDIHLPLKSEIEALKLLLEEEERRLSGPLEMTSYVTHSSRMSPTPVANAMTYTQPSAPSPSPPPAPQPLYQTSLEPVYVPMTGYDLGGVTTQEEVDGVGAGMEGWGGTRYTYETTPSVNKLQIEPSPPVTPRPVGPVMRAKSAPDEVAKVFAYAPSKAKCRYGNYQKLGKPWLSNKNVRFNQCNDQFQRFGYYSKTFDTFPAKNKYDKAKTRYPKASQSRPTNVPMVATSLGQGKDYFDEMFRDLTRETLYTQSRPKSSPTDRYPTSVYHDYNTATSSAIGDIKILEVNQEGKYVRLFNEGKQESEFGGFMIQQNVGGHPVAVFRFPPRTKFPGNSTITVWSASNDPILHQPPSDYVWKEQQKWGTGPECTTILCKPNGQAIAWTTAAHRFTKNAYEQDTQVRPSSQDIVPEETADMNHNDADSLTEMTVNINEPKPETVYLRREKQQPPTLSPQKHPHGVSPGKEVHPHTGQPRPLTYGNDNSSVNRQSRSQTTRPDPVLGQPYAGVSAQKMGSAPLRKYTPSGTNIRGNGTVVNKSAGTIRVGPPSPFLTPLQQEFSSRSTSALVRFTT